MKLYMAGNFVIMGDKEKERAFQEKMKPCYRLGTFFYKKQLNVLIDLKKEQIYGKGYKEKEEKESIGNTGDTGDTGKRKKKGKILKNRKLKKIKIPGDEGNK